MAMIGNHSPPRFPSYLLDHVFVHLPLADLYACQRVCQEWRSAISYYPSLRPKLFTAPPVQTTTRPCKQPLNTAADVQLHPVFTAIEQDWSIILSTAVFSRSDTRNPKALQNFAVRDNMATYPAVKQVSIWVQIDGVYTPTGRARRGGSETGERRFETKVEREAGVRVGDTWDTFMELMANTRGIGPKDRTLRETFMTGQYHS
ncbi:hypothetical protein DFH27DRAFT_252307 [Peziza echinospora]|nr:hypothetical protein DFH27DRAFT_252307 [Peziza echinospora]